MEIFRLQTAEMARSKLFHAHSRRKHFCPNIIMIDVCSSERTDEDTEHSVEENPGGMLYKRLIVLERVGLFGKDVVLDVM